MQVIIFLAVPFMGRDIQFDRLALAKLNNVINWILG